MLDDILDFFDRRKRQRDEEQSSPTRNPGLPFEMPFLNGDDEQGERDHPRNSDKRRSAHRPSSNRSTDEGDWF